jgi:hypothetical protein
VTLAKFQWTARARPIVELGVGDTRTTVGQAVWDTSRWDNTAATWAGTEPTWHDITCDTHSYRCEYGRQRSTDRFTVGTANVTVDNTTGWADPNVVGDTDLLTVRPGRAIRMGVVHETFGVRWLFRGFVDAVIPVYDPTEPDTVQLDCIDALGEVNRAKFTAQAVAGDGETITSRIWRILDAAQWPPAKRDLQLTSTELVADDLAGQAADLLGQAADSGGGSVFGDIEARIVYRHRDWQTFTVGTPPDGEISNVIETGAGNRVMFGTINYLWFGDQVIEGSTGANNAVCPVRWERPFNRADIATRVIVAREGDPTSTVQLDDVEGQRLYGIEPFERTDLLTASDVMLNTLAYRFLNARHHTTSPRVRSVTLDARTADNALDLMSTVDVYLPSRYRCRLEYHRGTVFDEEYLATGVAHEITPNGWTLELNLDSAAPYAIAAGGWDGAFWDEDHWVSAVTDLVAEARELMEELT